MLTTKIIHVHHYIKDWSVDRLAGDERVPDQTAIYRIDWLTFDAMTSIECAGPFWLWAVCAAAHLALVFAYFEVSRLFLRASNRPDIDLKAKVLLQTFVRLFVFCMVSHLFYLVRAVWPCNLLWSVFLVAAAAYAWLLVVRVRHFGVLNLLQVLEYGNKELKSLKLTMVQTTQTEATYGSDEPKTD